MPGAAVSFTLAGGPFNEFTQPDLSVQQFQISINAGPDFYSFCTDLFHAFTDGNAVSYPAKPASLPSPPGLPVNIGRIGYLYNTFGPELLASPTDRAGLQIAIWELIYDASPDLNAGSFQVGPGPSDPAAIAAANSFLGLSAGKDQRAIFLNGLALPYPSSERLGNQGMITTERYNFANKPDDRKIPVPDANITITPPLATNEVGQPHTFVVTVQQSDGLDAGEGGDGVTGFVPAPVGHVDVPTMTTKMRPMALACRC